MKRLVWNKHTKRVIKHVAGWLCLLAGILMIITPGQGLLTILLGVYLLADEIPLFGKIRDGIHRKFPRLTDYAHRQGQRLRARFHHPEKEKD